jgi:AcrR family transcriptional regulator
MADRVRRSGEERREQIAEAALRLLAEGGAQRLTAVELGRAVGLRDASLFRHFPSKEAIVDAAIARFEGWLDGSLERPEADPLDRLRAFFAHRQALLRARPEILRLAFDDRLEEAAGAAGAARVREVTGRSRAFLRRCLEAARDAGRVRRDVPIDVLQWTVMGAMRGAALADADAPDIETVWAGVERLIAAPVEEGERR